MSENDGWLVLHKYEPPQFVVPPPLCVVVCEAMEGAKFADWCTSCNPMVALVALGSLDVLLFSSRERFSGLTWVHAVQEQEPALITGGEHIVARTLPYTLVCQVMEEEQFANWCTSCHTKNAPERAEPS